MNVVDSIRQGKMRYLKAKPVATLVAQSKIYLTIQEYITVKCLYCCRNVSKCPYALATCKEDGELLHINVEL
jgi:hypothetical protein